MNKKVLLLSLVILALLISAPVYAETKVLLDGKTLTFDVPPIVEQGRTLVPVRAIFEALGAEIVFDAASDTVIATKGTTIIKLKIGGNALKNDQPISLDVPAKVVSGRTMVPIRFISESLGATVNYEIATQSVQITSTNKANNAPMEPESIYIYANPSVFSLEIYDKYGNCLGHGSGFLIDNKGTAVTNYHVTENAYSARAKFTDGRLINITKILSTDEERDIAVIQLDGANYPSLTLGNSDTLITGQKILAIGNPLGLENTISDGIISSAKRNIDGFSYIQITAPISPGSSGGVLLNYKGEAIGITTAYYENGQNLNFAVPINAVKATLASEENSRILPVYQKILNDLFFENQYVSFNYPSNWFKEENQKSNAVLQILLTNADNNKSSILLTREHFETVSLEYYFKATIKALNESSSIPYSSYEVIPTTVPFQINNQTFYKIRVTGLVDKNRIEQVIYLTKHNSYIYLFLLTSAEEEFAQSMPVLDNLLKTLNFK